MQTPDRPISGWNWIALPLWMRCLVGILFAVAAAGLRTVFLQALGTRAAYITFFPAVTLAALVGGLPAGLVATAISALLAVYFWIEPVGQFTIHDPVDWLTLGIFLAGCALISAITEAMYRARARVRQAEADIRVAEETRRVEDLLHQSKRFARDLIESSFDCIKTLDVQGNLLSMNSAGQRMLEIDNFQPYLRACWIDFWKEEDRLRVAGAVAAARDGGVGHFQAFCPTRSGKPRWWDVIVTPIHAANGKIERLLAVSRNVTDSKQAEEKLQETALAMELALETVHAAGRAKDQFLATLSHELRTPLTPVLMTVSMLQQDATLPPRLRADLAMIRRNIEIQSRMVNDLLDLSRIINNKLELTLQPANVHDVLRRALDVCATHGNAKGLKINVALDAANYHVRADAARLQQAFWNLIQNAIKFTPPGGAVTITSRNDNGRIRVAVADTGCGIEPALLAKIFEPFEQGNRTGAESLQGLGLGLCIARRIIEAHNGTLTGASDGKNRGAVFTVELTTEKAAADDAMMSI